jgi:hypothetical protein
MPARQTGATTRRRRLASVVAPFTRPLLPVEVAGEVLVAAADERGENECERHERRE